MFLTFVLIPRDRQRLHNHFDLDIFVVSALTAVTSGFLKINRTLVSCPGTTMFNDVTFPRCQNSKETQNIVIFLSRRSNLVIL